MTSLLVTGAAGLLGHALREHAPSDTAWASRADADLTDFHATEALLERLAPRRILHCAAQVGGLGGNLIHSGEYFRNNILLNTNMLECARLRGVGRMVSFMSTCVFPADTAYPLREEALHDGPPHGSNFGYAYAKRMLAVQTAAYRHEWGCDFSVAIPTNMYGPHDNFSLTEGHAVPALIHRTYLAKQRGEPLMVWGSGTPLREFVYSDDIARLALWMLEDYHEPEPIILSSGIETSIAELTELVAKAVGFTGCIHYDRTKQDGQFRKPSDVSKLAARRPDFEWTSVEEGIGRTVEWFCSNYPKVRL